VALPYRCNEDERTHDTEGVLPSELDWTGWWRCNVRPRRERNPNLFCSAVCSTPKYRSGAWEAVRIHIIKLRIDFDPATTSAQDQTHNEPEFWGRPTACTYKQQSLIIFRIFDNKSHPVVLLIFNKGIYSVLTQHQYIIINTLVLATCFGFLTIIFRPQFTIWRYIHTFF
jgi:hypothetical protein